MAKPGTASGRHGCPYEQWEAGELTVHKRGYWNELADELAYTLCTALAVLLVVAAILLMFSAGKANHPFDGIIYWLSKIAAVFAAVCFTPMAFKIAAFRLDARRLARDQRK